MAVFNFNEDQKKRRKKKELPVTVYIQLQKRLTWLEQLTALFLFQLHYNHFRREKKKKNMYHISDLIQEKTNWPYLSFMPFFIRHRIYLTHCRYFTVSHNACITFCEEFNKLTIYLATTQRQKLKRTVTV